MKKQVFLILLLFKSILIIGQNKMAIVFIDKNIYKDSCVIFTKYYRPSFEYNKTFDRLNLFTPELSEISKADELLIKRYNIDLKSVTEVKNVKKKFKYHRRQYFGYINDLGEKIVNINLLNFKNRKNSEHDFFEWRTEYIFGYGRFYERNTYTFEVNLNTGILKFP